MMARTPWLSRLLVAASLASAALVPLLNPQLPRSADGRPHLFRIILLDNAIRNGEWWPRYSPELAYRNGYPLINIYAPLTYYLGVVLHGLGLDFVPALHAIFAFTLIFGGWGAFTLAADWFGRFAGGVAAAAFVFAPYTLFNTLTRGAAPEALAVALLPWLLWSLHHALRAPSALALLRLSLLYAALLLTHNLTALLGTGLLGVWLVVEIVTARPHVSRVTLHVSLVTLSFLCGLALAAFFWLPALLETGAVQVAQLTAPATLDFRNYFLSFAQLFTPTFTFDPRLEPVSVPVAFGVVNAAFAVLALLLWRRYPNHIPRWRIAVLGWLCAVFLWMALALSQPVWEAVNGLRVIQFPWRFLGPASVCAALLCGAAVSALGERVARWLSPVLV
ncbi:MAG: 6-pyruvoyl-tetrahydropterin synthase-related protein, partial [Anaerolineales bacterium]